MIEVHRTFQLNELRVRIGIRTNALDQDDITVVVSDPGGVSTSKLKMKTNQTKQVSRSGLYGECTVRMNLLGKANNKTVRTLKLIYRYASGWCLQNLLRMTKVSLLLRI